MTRFLIPRAAAALAVAALAMPAAAFAQTTAAPAPTTPAPAAASPVSTAAPAAAPLPKDVAAKVEQHIKQLHDQLGITAAEQSQWDQFAQVMRDNATQMGDAFHERGAKLASMTAAENMQSYAQVAQVHATNMQKLASSFQSLYNTFPDQQKQVANAVFQNNNGRPLPRKH